MGLREPVQLGGAARKLFDDAAIWAARNGSEIRLVSANDHRHSHGSAHYRDEAVDLQAGRADLDGVAAWMAALGYRVYWRLPGHWSHVHAEIP